MKMIPITLYYPIRSFVVAAFVAGLFGVLFVVCIAGELLKAAWATLVLGKTAEDQLRDAADGEDER